jgi:class 3 adenylate cyclase
MNKEQNIAILMADLSGYSALTEAHGAVSAADLIDKYMAIVKDCLVGDSKLTERVGDEVMIVSASADDLLSTAARIIKNTSKEDNFLQVHGGLHYGEVLNRNDSYFGSTVNLTSRIAGKANPGTFWCSGEFMNALANKSLFKLKPRGKHLFKNIHAEKEVFEVSMKKTKTTYIDPVCRMLILNPQKAIRHPGHNEHYFCSSHCLNSYRGSQIY